MREQLARLYASQGDVFVRKNQYDAAKPLLEKATGLTSEIPQLQQELAFCYGNTGQVKIQHHDFRGAEADLRRAAECSPMTVTPELHFCSPCAITTSMIPHANDNN